MKIATRYRRTAFVYILLKLLSDGRFVPNHSARLLTFSSSVFRCQNAKAWHRHLELQFTYNRFKVFPHPSMVPLVAFQQSALIPNDKLVHVHIHQHVQQLTTAKYHY